MGIFHYGRLYIATDQEDVKPGLHVNHHVAVLASCQIDRATPSRCAEATPTVVRLESCCDD